MSIVLEKVKTLEDLNLEEKRRLYTQWIKQLREDKVKETQKKLAYYGYTDEDDYHILTPPEGYSWKPVPTHANGDFHGYSGWSTNYKAMTETFPPVVVHYSSVCGNFHKILQKFRKVRENPDYDFSEYKPNLEKYATDHCIGQVHHFCGDVQIGLELGWGGLLKKVQEYARINIKDDETKAFYDAEEMFIKTVIAWIKRTSDAIEKQIEEENDPLMKDNLRGMLAANRAVETGVPKTMREACQFIAWYNIAGRSYNREGCGGQLDALLSPYYFRDKEAGVIDDEDAVFYITGVLMSDTKYYQVGGPDEKGEDLTNCVSWLVMEAADRLDVTANLTVRVHDKLDRDFFRYTVELLFKHKNAWPRFSGDNALVSGYMKNGVSAELARKRIAVGCNWMAIPGIEFCQNDSIKINFAKIFEIAFDEVIAQEEPSVDLLWEIFEKHLDVALNTVFKTTDFQLRTSQYNSPELFLNLFTVGPIEKGRNATDHCLQLYTIGVDGAGIAVAADSFAALEQRIEKEHRITWLKVLNAVRSNYSGPAGRWAQKLLSTAEKFGQFDSLGLKWAKKISETFTKKVVAGKSNEGVQFVPGLFSWSKTITFGEKVGATPDGRNAGAPINHGANPMPGAVKSGEMTTMSEAIAEIQPGWGNTAPFQMELDPGLTAMEGGIEKVMSLLETHLNRGGTLINVNIVNADKIRAAHKNPEQHPDLVVRVTGFTAYFISLSPEFRKLVVDRVMEAV
jgi:formate C-acetyltransferase